MSSQSLRGLRSTFRLVAVVAIGVIAVLPGTLVASSAVRTSPSFLMTLAGPSVAPMYPSGLVWDGHMGRLVVADTGYNRISIFQASNWQTPTLQFGTLGTATGQFFDTPRQVAVDASSNIYVADAGNSRVQSFTSAGVWRWATPSGGKLPSSLNVPIGVTYDFTNNAVLVADTGHSVIKAFNPSNGTFLWASPTGLLKSPRDAIRGPDGHIWVADYNHEQVKAFNVTSTGVWNSTPAIVLGDGAPNGHLLGQLNAPYNVQFSSPDPKTVYVADTGNERISRWDISVSPPAPLSAFGSRCPKICPPPPGNAGNFNALRRVAVDTAGDIWAADFWGSGIHEFQRLRRDDGRDRRQPCTGARICGGLRYRGRR